MAGYRDVFQRKELKYRITRMQRDRLLDALDGRVAHAEYGFSHIASTYYDTPDRLLARRSIGRPRYKEKLRLREYGAPEADEMVFVEIKKKLDGIVYKRRVGMSRDGARAYLSGEGFERSCALHPLRDAAAQKELSSSGCRLAAREIDAFRTRYAPLAPFLKVTCERESFAEVLDAGKRCGAIARTEAQGVRITFDSSIAWEDMGSQSGEAHPLLPDGYLIMEVKAVGALPLWLVRQLDDADILPSSFSKYGEAYLASLRLQSIALRKAALDEPHSRPIHPKRAPRATRPLTETSSCRAGTAAPISAPSRSRIGAAAAVNACAPSSTAPLPYR